MQLQLFERNIIYDVYLVADSKKQAFYRLRLVYDGIKYFVEKESGAGGRVLDRRQWHQPDQERAGLVFARKLAAKLKDGKSPRQYFIRDAE